MKILKNRLVIFSIKTLLGICVLSYVFIKFDYQMIVSEVKNISFSIYIFVILGHFALMAIKSWRWHLLCKSANLDIHYHDALRAYTAAFSLGTFTPGQLGDLSKVLLIDIKEKKRKTALLTVVEDRLWDVIGLMLISILSFLFLFIASQNSIKSVWPLLLLFIFLFGILLLSIKVVSKFFINKYDLNITHFFKNWKIPSLITSIAITIQFLRWSILAIALNQPIILSACSATIGTFVALLPISIAGIGTREATMAYLFKLNDLNANLGITFSILMLGAYLVTAIFGSILLIFIRTKNTDEN